MSDTDKIRQNNFILGTNQNYLMSKVKYLFYFFTLLHNEFYYVQ
jgi:hypothetical protein